MKSGGTHGTGLASGASTTASSGPEIQIFGRFRDHWNNINKTNISSGLQDPIVAEFFPDHIRGPIIAFIKE